MPFHLFSRTDINKGIAEWKQTENAILLDVRTREEYKDGHVPQSIHIDVNEIDKARDIIQDKNVQLFVYCYSGARSARAVSALQGMGYHYVKNIGGISAYRGRTVKGV
ncbi:MAG: rhodanese-like domain-containing protein [Clostridiales bacterium]|nr:rhodanese-like domain-containing protein [Clostridiales bacterium]